MEDKVLTRSKILERRDALSAEVRAQKSALICDRLEEEISRACENIASPTVAVYAAMRSEVDLTPFIQRAYQRGWTVCFPCMVWMEESNVQPPTAKRQTRMAFFQVSRESFEAARELFLNKPLRCLACTTLQHEGYAEVSPQKMDAMVVPLVAFDIAGNRLGYGGGNYDRCLPQLSAHTYVAGVAFDEQCVPTVPCEAHDCRLPRVISA